MVNKIIKRSRDFIKEADVETNNEGRIKKRTSKKTKLSRIFCKEIKKF